MADSIFSVGPLPAPVSYTVPGSSVVVPLACNAVFDGAGASGDFVPALVFRDQAGNVISRAPVETTVAAGGSAEVSWFPGVKRGGGTTAFAPTSCVAASDAPIGNVTAGTNPVTWTSIVTNDAATFTISGTDATTVLVHEYGYYLMGVSFLPVSNPLSLTTPLTIEDDVEDANGIGPINLITDPIDIRDATVADPKEVHWLEGFDYFSGSSGYTLPFHVRVFIVNIQTINVSRVKVFLTRLNPAGIV